MRAREAAADDDEDDGRGPAGVAQDNCYCPRCQQLRRVSTGRGKVVLTRDKGMTQYSTGGGSAFAT